MSLIKSALAASSTQLGEIGSKNLAQNATFVESSGAIKWNVLVQTGVNMLFFIAGVATLVYFLWGGIDMIMSNGERDRFVKGRDRMVFAAIGMVIVGASFAIWTLVMNIIGITQLDPGI
ncbi:hypothetical protein IJJ27_00030 [bacterium]|nr:hypothetical protein [bacterium]MBQ6435938.1 hypothetical protein [bacterium]